LQIETWPFIDPNARVQLQDTIDYQTIGRLYEMIIECKTGFAPCCQQTTYYPQIIHNLLLFSKFDEYRSIMTVHNCKFANTDDSGGLVGVLRDSRTAIEDT
jgi:hypothetical protein